MRLYGGEELKLNNGKSEHESKMSFEEITRKYHQGQVRIVTEQAR